MKPLSERFSRQTVLPEVGVLGQKRLRDASILIIGVGGLGSPAALYLAAAGIGRLGLVDDDQVALSNLQRQILYTMDDLGRRKVDAGAERLLALNPEVQLEVFDQWVNAASLKDILPRFDLVLDATDNFETRYAVNEACVLAGKPNISAAVQGFEGQLGVFYPPFGPCYRCLYPEPPMAGAVPSCEENGVLGVVPGTLGILQATEAIKLLLNIGRPLVGAVLVYDALAMQLDTFGVERAANCATCGGGTCSRKDDPVEPSKTFQKPSSFSSSEISRAELLEAVASNKNLQLLDVRSLMEFRAGHLEGAIHLPVQELEERLAETENLDPLKPTLIYCHAGVRSRVALQYLQAAGFKDVCHLKDGIG